MPFEDLAQLVEPLALPIRGKTYTLPVVSLEDGILLRSVFDGKPDPSLTDGLVNKILLGDALAEMVADGVSDEWVGRVLLTAMADLKSGRFQAELMWRTGGDPKALDQVVRSLAPNRKARRASTSTGAAGTTKPPASTSGTRTSRKK